MDLRKTFEHYYPENTIGPGSGVLKGQCAVFAQTLVQMPKVGNTIQTKKAACQQYGILRKNITEFRPGDVLVLDVGTVTGHIAVITSTDQNRINLSDSNWKNDLRVHHGRYILTSSPQIYGIFRGALKVPVLADTPPLQKTFMSVTVVANAVFPDLQTKLDTLKQWFLTYSGNKLEPVFTVKQTLFNPVPFSKFISYDAVDVNWYRENITPLATGELSLFIVQPDLWTPTISFGTMTYGDPSRPVRVEICYSDDLPYRAFHEICHALLFLTGQPDVDPDNPTNPLVHKYLYQDPPKYGELLSLVNYRALQEKLVTINN